MQAEQIDPDAPFGYKADGVTPRKRPAPEWMSDPVKLAAAVAKRSAPRAKKPAAKPAKRRTTPAITNGDASDLLAGVKREIDERLRELAPLVDEHRRLEAAREALA